MKPPVADAAGGFALRRGFVYADNQCILRNHYLSLLLRQPETSNPHFHARYQGQQAAVSILDGEVLEGELPSAKMKLVQAWQEIHREDLMADWELAVNGQTPFPIEPLC
nr:DUF4160 domain-containing protein [Desulfuromonas sp. TF]